MQDLPQRCIKLVITDDQDSDGVGFVQWRPAFYVIGDIAGKPLANFLALLGEWWEYKSNALGHRLEIHYNLHATVGGMADIAGQLAYEPCSICGPMQRVPLGIFEAHPVTSKRIVTLTVQPETGDTVSIVVAGNMSMYHARFDTLGIPGNVTHAS